MVAVRDGDIAPELDPAGDLASDGVEVMAVKWGGIGGGGCGRARVATIGGDGVSLELSIQQGPS